MRYRKEIVNEFKAIFEGSGTIKEDDVLDALMSLEEKYDVSGERILSMREIRETLRESYSKKEETEVLEEKEETEEEVVSENKEEETTEEVVSENTETEEDVVNETKEEETDEVVTESEEVKEEEALNENEAPPLKVKKKVLKETHGEVEAIPLTESAKRILTSDYCK